MSSAGLCVSPRVHAFTHTCAQTTHVHHILSAHTLTKKVENVRTLRNDKTRAFHHAKGKGGGSVELTGCWIQRPQRGKGAVSGGKLARLKC